jgi:polyisoprenoid-binding protein YceI
MATRTLKLLLASLVSLGLLVGAASTAVAQDGVETLEVDPVHSNVLFRAKHFNVGYVYGEFLKKEGTIKYHPKDPSKTSIELTLATDSIDTNFEKRDKHLKSPDFFNAKQFPKITFKSTKVKEDGDNLKVTGKLTINGKTKTVTADIEKVGAGEDPQGKFRRGFHTTFTIDRHDFGVDFMKGALGADVKVIVAVEGVRSKE